MIDWNSPEEPELAKDARIFNNLIHSVTGLYAMEFVMSVNFDLDFLLGRKRFRWPMVFYFLGRYALMFALVGITISLNVTTEIDCQALYVFNQICGNISIGCACTNLSFRTIAVYAQDRYVAIMIFVLALGQWGLLFHGLVIHARWVDGAGCVLEEANTVGLTALFIYTMCYDFIVLCLTAWKLGVNQTGMIRSRLTNLIFTDGLIYFVVAFVFNTIATTFIILNLNAVMSVLFDVPAAIFSTIVASRAVRHLTEFSNRTYDVYGSSRTSNLNSSGSVLASGGTLVFKSSRQKKSNADAVHIQTDMFSITETHLGESFFDMNPSISSLKPEEFRVANSGTHAL